MTTEVGTRLHDLFAHVVADMPGCDCAAIVDKMNRLGPEWCLDNVDELASEIRNSAVKWKDAAGKVPWRGRAECNSDLLQMIINKSVAALPLPPAAVFRMLILHVCDQAAAAPPEDEKDQSSGAD